MAQIILRRKVIALRKLGKSYRQIKQEIKVSKSTLSNWLKNYPLTRDQIYNLSHNDKSTEKYRTTMQLKREKQLLGYYDEAKLTLPPISKRELYLAGLLLYWDEGSKANRYRVSISNTDPAVLKFSIYWIVHALEVPKEKIHIDLHLFSDMNIHAACEYWSKELKIPIIQFSKPYIKQSKKTAIDHKGFGHGTCHVRVNDTVLHEKIMMAIKAIADFFEPTNPQTLML